MGWAVQAMGRAAFPGDAEAEHSVLCIWDGDGPGRVFEVLYTFDS